LIVGRVASHEVAEGSAHFRGTNRRDSAVEQTSLI